MSQISVIVPIYNNEETLEKCLNSIKRQTYTDFEVLMVNDGSSDNSEEICKKYCEQDSRFKLMSQKNSGPSVARNNAIDKSISKYLAFVDSDDYIEHTMLEELYKAAEENDADLTVCGYIMENGNKVEKCCAKRFESGLYAGEECKKVAVDTINICYHHNIRPFSWIRFVKRDCMEKPRLRFNPKVYRGEDYLLWTQVFFNINRLYIINDKFLYHYISRGDSITNSYIPNYWEMAVRLYDELIKSLPNEKGIVENLNYMFMQRSYIALNIASQAENEEVFNADVKKVFKDKLLRKAIKTLRCSGEFRRFKKYCTLMRLHMYGLIKMKYFAKFRDNHKK